MLTWVWSKFSVCKQCVWNIDISSIHSTSKRLVTRMVIAHLKNGSEVFGVTDSIVGTIIHSFTISSWLLARWSRKWPVEYVDGVTQLNNFLVHQLTPDTRTHTRTTRAQTERWHYITHTHTHTPYKRHKTHQIHTTHPKTHTHPHTQYFLCFFSISIV